VISNKRGAYARMLAEHLGFAGKMARVIGAEDGFAAKPAPDMFEEFMRHVHSDRGNTIYVGDAPLDVEAGRNAGIDVFAVAGPHFSPEELARHRPRRVLHRITDLPAAVAPLL
jgi:phosphoglycolate phosphatase-like HAD superfamily hydrolase